MEIITPWELYLWTRLDVFGHGFGILSFICILIGAPLWVMSAFNSDQNPLLKRLGISGALLKTLPSK